MSSLVVKITDTEKLLLSDVFAELTTFKGKKAIKVTMSPSLYQNPEKDILTDRPLFAWFPMEFSNGTIELHIASEIALDAPNFARGFVGIAFRIDEEKRFEGLYLRPANSRVDDQVRRNHSVQYFSYPDFDFARLRKESPEQYESYTDMELGEWIHMKIEVSQNKAYLYVNNMEQPVLIVNDLKRGSSQKGGIGLWLESGTIGYFNNITITQKS